MVTQWGFSDKVGAVCLSVDKDNLSFETRELIDQEVKRILSVGFIVVIDYIFY